MSDEMAMVIELLRAGEDTRGASIEEQRAQMDAIAGAAPLAEGTVVEEVTVAGRPAEWLRPPGVDEDRALLYLHGGGYVIGSLVSHRAMASKFGAAAGLPVLVLDYRMGPEHRFPAAIDDATSAFRELLDGGLDPASVAIAGDSAGGGLTLASLLALRDAGGPLPGAAACISPWSDLTMSSPSMDANVDSDPMLDRERLQWFADHYLGPDGDAGHPLASPRHADLSGLPPLLVHAAEEEVLLDDARLVAEAVEAAGGTVEYRTWSGCFHVFHATAGLTPEADEAVGAMGDFLRHHLA